MLDMVLHNEAGGKSLEAVPNACCFRWSQLHLSDYSTYVGCIVHPAAQERKNENRMHRILVTFDLLTFHAPVNEHQGDHRLKYEYHC